VNDAYTVTEDSNNNLNVLANDTDPDGDPLTITAVSTPANGTATISGGGNRIQYQPALNYTGPDSFTYTISDGTNTADATVSITVSTVNDPPDAVNDTPTVEEGSSANAISVLANDTDPEGAILSISAVDTTSTQGGTVSVSGTQVLYTPPSADFTGTDTFTYTASDGDKDDTATVTVTVNGVGTGAPYDDDQPTAEDDGSAGTPLATLEDTPLTIFLYADNGNGADVLPVVDVPFTLTITTGAATHGTVTVVSAVTGEVTFTPDRNYNGAAQFSYTLTDSSGSVESATVFLDVTPVDDLPVANEDCILTKTGNAATVNVLANDDEIDDLNEGPIVVTIDTAPASGTAVVNVDNTITYTPAAGFSGELTFAYQVEDANGDTDVGTVTVHVFRQAMESTVAANDAYGTAIASLGTSVGGDSTHDFAIGAPGAGTGGRVYIVDGGNGDILATIDSPSNGNGGGMAFGTALAVANGRLYVGAPGWDTGNQNVGRVFSYVINSWGGFEFEIPSPTNEQNGRFGGVIVPFRNINPGNGVTTFDTDVEILVGMPRTDYGANDGGRVYVFDGDNFNEFGSGLGGSVRAIVTNPEPDNGDQFGAALAVGDVTGDGTVDVVVGAPGSPVNGSAAAGSVYLYNGTAITVGSDTASTVNILDNPDEGAGDRFGSSVGVVEVGDAGTEKEIVVGAPFADEGALVDSGALFLLEAGGTLIDRIANPTPAMGDEFGSVLDVSSDEEIWVGAPGKDVGLVVDAGGIYVFSGDGTLMCQMDNPDAEDGDRFGAVIYAGGNDAYGIGVPDDNAGGLDGSGSAYILGGN
jgi:hypothetical protein